MYNFVLNGLERFACFIIITNGIVITVGKAVVTDNTLSSTGIPIRIDKPPPARVIIPALEVIQLSLYGVNLAVRVKLGEKKLEITGFKSADYAVPGEGLPLPGFSLWNIRESTV